MSNITLIMHAVVAVIAVYIGSNYLQTGELIPILLTFSLAFFNVVAIVLRIYFSKKR